MLKPYHKSCEDIGIISNVSHTELDNDDMHEPQLNDKVDIVKPKLNNSDVLQNLDEKLSHLEPNQREDIKELIYEFQDIFSDTPTRTTEAYHDVDVGDSPPIKQHPYRLNPVKAELMKKEIQYMLDNDIAQPSQSSWSSPCILVPKPDGSVRFCTDYRKVNSVTKTDTYPLPRIDDCIDKVGKAKYVTKIGLLKG